MILVTGAAGFIGHALCRRLLARGEEVVGVDVFNTYYEVSLKEARAATLAQEPRFRMERLDIAEPEVFAALVERVQPTTIVHLAAQAGVRYSLENPFAYERANLAGHLSVLEACRHSKSVKHLVYASSSSVYGKRGLAEGFKETDAVDAPVSLYAATKRSGELISASYSTLYGLAQTGLRFFTVYGPWGRPDMAAFIFTRKILAGEPIEVFGQGEMMRDFTFVEDIIDGVVGVIDHPAGPGEARLFNIGDNRPVALMHMIASLEAALGREAQKTMLPMQLGDVPVTYADISKLKALTGYQPKVMIEDGLKRFVEWYRDYYRA